MRRLALAISLVVPAMSLAQDGVLESFHSLSGYKIGEHCSAIFSRLSVSDKAIWALSDYKSKLPLSPSYCPRRAGFNDAYFSHLLYLEESQAGKTFIVLSFTPNEKVWKIHRAQRWEVAGMGPLLAKLNDDLVGRFGQPFYRMKTPNGMTLMWSTNRMGLKYPQLPRSSDRCDFPKVKKISDVERAVNCVMAKVNREQDEIAKIGGIQVRVDISSDSKTSRVSNFTIESLDVAVEEAARSSEDAARRRLSEKSSEDLEKRLLPKY